MTQTTLFDPIWHGAELQEGWDDWDRIWASLNLNEAAEVAD